WRRENVERHFKKPDQQFGTANDDDRYKRDDRDLKRASARPAHQRTGAARDTYFGLLSFATKGRDFVLQGITHRNSPRLAQLFGRWSIIALIASTRSRKSGVVWSVTGRGRGRSTSTILAIRPGRADITTIRSARKTASAMEWVMKMMV